MLSLTLIHILSTFRSETASFTSSSSGSTSNTLISPLCGWELDSGSDAAAAAALSEGGVHFGWSFALIGSSSSPSFTGGISGKSWFTPASLMLSFNVTGDFTHKLFGIYFSSIFTFSHFISLTFYLLYA